MPRPNLYGKNTAPVCANSAGATTGQQSRDKPETVGRPAGTAGDRPGPLAVDFTQASTLIGLLFSPGDVVELRCIHPQNVMPPFSRWHDAELLFAPEIEPGGWAALDEMGRANSKGFGIFFGLNPRQKHGARGDAGVKLARCYCCDIDGLDDPPAALPGLLRKVESAGLPAPTAAIDSGHGAWLYWRQPAAMTDLKLWRTRQRNLALKLGADTSIHNPERVARLPGFWNTKREPFKRAALLLPEAVQL